MIAHYNIIQQTEEWHQIKWGKIGGTLSAGLFIPTETLFIDIASQNIEEYEPMDSFQNYHMDRGNEYELFAREYLEQYTGLKFKECGWLQSEENRLLGISPDGITECETIACEIKCLARKAHFEVLLTNEIPTDKIKQCIHYFTVNPKLESLWFIAYRPEAPSHFIKELKRDSFVDVGLTETIEIKQIGKKGNEIKPKIEKRKKLVTIDEATKIALDEANKLLQRIESLNFNTF